MTLGLNLSAAKPLKRLSGGHLTVPNVSDQSKPAVAAGRLCLRLPKSPGGIKINSRTSPISGLAALAAGFRNKVGPKGHRAYLEKNNQHTTPIKNQGKNQKSEPASSGRRLSCRPCIVQSRDGLLV